MSSDAGMPSLQLNAHPGDELVMRIGIPTVAAAWPSMRSSTATRLWSALARSGTGGPGAS